MPNVLSPRDLVFRPDMDETVPHIHNFKNIQSKVMVLVHDTLSQCALEVYEASTK